MKKKWLAYLLALASAVLCLLPAPAQATEAGHTGHCLCGGTTHKDIGDHKTADDKALDSAEWVGVKSLDTKNGGIYNFSKLGHTYYYLENDVVVTGNSASNAPAWNVQGNVVLCLNGHSIKLDGVDDKVYGSTIQVAENVTLTIVDCKGTGTITHNRQKAHGCGVVVAKGATFNLYGGSITENGTRDPVYWDWDYTGAGVKNNGKFNMYGGSITDNHGMKRNGTGGASGAGVYNNGTFKLYDGTISNNDTGSVTGKTSGGGGVYNAAQKHFYMYGGTISGNSCSRASGVMTVGTFDMSGGQITGNKDGYAVMALEGGWIWLSGNAQICGNKNVDIEYASSGTVKVICPLGDEAKIGFARSMKLMTGGSTAAVTADINAGKFVVNDENMAVRCNSSYSYVYAYRPHKAHYLCGSSDNTGCTFDACKTAGAEEFKEWASNDGLPTSGKYYLAGDVTLTTRPIIKGNLTLCLNGYEIKAPSGISVNGGTLTITDCQDTGKLGGSSKELIGVRVETSASTLNLYGGTIADFAYGVKNIGTFNLYGGKLTGNIEGVHNESSFTMRGGTITKNNCGVGNYAAGTFTMYGGAVTANSGYCNGTGVYNEGTFIMHDGAITNNNAYRNTSKGYGGGVYNSGNFTMHSGSITGNTSDDYGGGVYNSGDFIMRGGSITGNTGYLIGGVCNIKGTMTLAGKVTISGNKDTEEADSNLYADEALTIAGDMTGSRIGLLVDSNMADGDPLLQRGENYTITEKDAKCFDFDDKTDGCEMSLASDGSKVLLVLPHEHYLCGGTSAHKDCTSADCTDVVKFERWDKTDSLPTKGAWYLAENVTLNGEAQLTGDLTLCLNDCTITQGSDDRVFSVTNGHTLTVTDCKTSGSITRPTGSSWSGVYVSSTFNLYAGNITGIDHSTPSAGGGTVFVADGGTFNMYGGSITGNKAENGGGIFVRAASTSDPAGTFNMYGGIISGNSATKSGGGVYLDGQQQPGGNFNLYGGSITNNSATSYGGGVYVGGGKFTVNSTAAKAVISSNRSDFCGGGVYVDGTGAKADIKGCTIRGNQSAWEGGGVYVSKGSVTLDSVTLTENTASAGNGGGGIYLPSSDGSVTVKDSTITKNKARYDGGGVLAFGGYLTLDGKVIIKDNRDSSTEAADDLYVDGTSKGRVSIIANTFDTESKVIFTERFGQYTGAYYVSNAEALNAEQLDCLTTDKGREFVKADDGKVYVATALDWSQWGPVKNTGLTYNGTEQTGVTAPDGADAYYTVESTQAWQANAAFAQDSEYRSGYTAVVKLKPGYAWYDSTTGTYSVAYKNVVWSIAAKEAAAEDFVVDTSTLTTTYGETYQGVGVTVAEKYTKNGEDWTGKLEVQYKAANGDWTDAVPTDAGTYQLRVHIAQGGSFVAGDVALNETLTIRQRTAVITVNAASKRVGAKDPAFTGSVTGLLRDGDLGEIAYVRAVNDAGKESAGDDITITAQYTENPNYDITVNTAKLTINAKQTRQMFFDNTSMSRSYVEAATNGLTVIPRVAVTYESSNKAVATVDENTGAVTIVGVGETTITARAAETDDYQAASASYKLTVYAAKPTYIVPAGLTGDEGQTLGDIQLPTVADAAEGTPGHWEWTDNVATALTAAPDGSAAERTFKAKFVPNDPNYATVTDVAVTVQVNHVHVYDKQVQGEAYLASKATCTAPAAYLYSCGCGAVDPDVTHTYTDGTELGHDFENGTWQSVENDTKHAKKCSRCDQLDTAEAHTVRVAATCQNKAVCDVCGLSFGALADHDYNTADWVFDGAEHWHACRTSGCDSKQDKAAHSYADADATVCEVCGAPCTLPELTGEVEIIGELIKGEQLTVVTSKLPGTAAQLRCQWLRNGKPIAGATDVKYTLTDADVDAEISVIVTAAGHSGQLRADATGQVGVIYTVSYDASPRQDLVKSGTGYTLPNCDFITAPAKKTFDMWQIDGVSYEAGTTYRVMHDVTVTALWKDAGSDDGDDKPNPTPSRPSYSGPTMTAVPTAEGRSATDYSGGIYGLTFRSTAGFSSFLGVQVDGVTLDRSHYIVEGNGIEVYLKAVHLQTLKAGTHTMTILASEGNTSMEFTIGGVSSSPKTFDAGVAGYAAMALLGLTGSALCLRRKEDGTI